MCTAKPPKQTAPVEKDPQYMRNPWLDNMSMNRASTVGRNSLRTDSARVFNPAFALPPPTGPHMPPTGPYTPPSAPTNPFAKYADFTGGGMTGALLRNLGKKAAAQNTAAAKKLDY